MNKLIILLVLAISFSSFAQDVEETPVEVNDEAVTNVEEVVSEKPVVEEAPVVVEEKPAEEFVPVVVAPVKSAHKPALNIETDLEDTKKFNPRASHWVWSFGFEESKYDTIFEFQGKKDFEKSKKELFGMRLGFGGELYLGAGFVTRSMLETYYHGTLFSRVLNGGDQDEDVKFAYTKQVGQLVGLDASQSLGWMFDFKTRNPFLEEWAYLTVEPFVEAGIGKAWAYNRLNYNYKLAATDEGYKLTVRDDLLNARIGGGINFTANSGFFLTLKATVNSYDITKRNIKGFTHPDGGGTTEINDPNNKDAKIHAITIYTLGGGYKF